MTPKKLTTRQTAELLGREPATVASYCYRHAIGELDAAGTRWLTPADVERVRAAKAGGDQRAKKKKKARTAD